MYLVEFASVGEQIDETADVLDVAVEGAWLDVPFPYLLIDTLLHGLLFLRPVLQLCFGLVDGAVAVDAYGVGEDLAQ